jgi:hypothetical protein
MYYTSRNLGNWDLVNTKKILLNYFKFFKLWVGVVLGEGRRELILCRTFLDSVIFVVYSKLLSTSLIFLFFSWKCA